MDRGTENIGFLIVEVRTASGAIPIEGALVYVYPSGEGENDVLYSLRTNSSGMSERVALATRNKDLSTSPGVKSPFISYNVAVSAPGYYGASKSNVPIFEGVSSILPFDLIPLSENSNPNSFTPDGIGRFTVTPETRL